VATLRTTTADMQDIIEKYKVGHRFFLNIDLNGEDKLVGQIGNFRLIDPHVSF